MNKPSFGGMGGGGDPRDRKPTFDIYKVDYAWVEK